ncbi:hypothetical protein DVH24_041223 [Malus domestica]|uniref:Uncharacterized protein n=1 Tax=Malus domestica TaxID=3750 RepID=A0A498I9F8_MALDO|nr:hypothetical protein DVH24_041223 [Malus domestica]
MSSYLDKQNGYIDRESDDDQDDPNRSRKTYALVAALPLSEGGEETQLKRIAQLQAENDTRELQEVRELFGEAANHYVNMKKSD